MPNFIYEITALVDENLSEDFEDFMRTRHIPDVIATREFISAIFVRSSPGRYRVYYLAKDRAALNRYLEEHSPRLRTDVAARFPTGVTISRENWEVVASFDHENRASDILDR